MTKIGAKVKRVLLQGYYGFGNFGDDLLLVCTYSAIRQRYPDAEVVVFSNFTPNLAGYKQTANYNQYINHLLGEKLQLIDWTYEGQFDLIVHGGGGVFFDTKYGTWRDGLINLVARGLGSPIYARVMSGVRRVLGRPHRLIARQRVGLGIGVGPYTFSGSKYKRDAEILGDFDCLAVRDLTSLGWASRLGAGAVTRCYTDLVFGVERWLKSRIEASVDKEYLGFVLCQGKAGNAQLLNQAKAVAGKVGLRAKLFFLDENHDAVMIHQCQSDGFDVVVWRPCDMVIEDYLRELNACKFLISNRAHGSIVGACLHIPSICVNTDPKLRAVQGMIPRGSRLLPVPIDDIQLHDMVVEVNQAYSEMQKGLVLDLQDRATEVQRMVADVLR
jgi:polysaccharide pyruvyl transferase WcaK-like protein